MSYTVYLCEKPDQGRKVAKELGIVSKKQDHIVCKNDTIVTWGYGHLISLKMPEDYNEDLKKWSWDTLPIIPKPFQYKPIKTSYTQLKAIETLCKNASHIVISTDPDREGELIAYLILNYIKWKGPLSRLWIEDLSPTGIKKALKNPKPSDETKYSYYAALARSCSDWLVGMNISRAIALKIQEKNISVGRVQTPTLWLITKREREIRNFKPYDYYDLKATVKTEKNHTLSLLYTPEEKKRITDKEKAEAIAKSLTGTHQTLTVKTEKKEQDPPSLFDLTSLQQEGNSRFGWSAKKTLEITQKLYDGTNGSQKALITYPRTDCDVLPEDHKTLFDDKRKALQSIFGEEIEAPFKQKTIFRQKHYDDKKLQSHYAIVPTEETAPLDSLSPDERKLYSLIVKRYLAAHMEDYEYLSTTISFLYQDMLFKTSGQQPTHIGWKALYTEAEDTETDETEEKNNKLPPIQDGENSLVKTVDLLKKTTKPPKRYTEKTLLQDMKNISSHVTNPEHKKILKETSGIGTTATRGEVIEKLKAREYIALQKKYISPTKLGEYLIESLEKNAPKYCDPGETALWEEILKKIESKSENVNKLIEETINHVSTDITVLKNSKIERANFSQSKNTASGQNQNTPSLYTKEQRETILKTGIPVKVPHAEKEKAKKMGAIWNQDKKTWMIPNTINTDAFKKAGYL